MKQWKIFTFAFATNRRATEKKKWKTNETKQKPLLKDCYIIWWNVQVARKCFCTALRTNHFLYYEELDLNFLAFQIFKSKSVVKLKTSSIMRKVHNMSRNVDPDFGDQRSTVFVRALGQAWLWFSIQVVEFMTAPEEAGVSLKWWS